MDWWCCYGNYCNNTAVKKLKSKEEQIKTFEQIEGRFALQAKITTLLTGLSGFYMLYVLDAWNRYLDIKYWWIHAMTLVWIIFTIVLYILEPLVLHKLFKRYAEKIQLKPLLLCIDFIGFYLF